jgi:hypothetical protein
MSEISLITKPNADETAVKMMRIISELSRGDVVISAPKIPVSSQRMPYASNRTSLLSGW